MKGLNFFTVYLTCDPYKHTDRRSDVYSHSLVFRLSYCCFQNSSSCPMIVFARPRCRWISVMEYPSELMSEPSHANPATSPNAWLPIQTTPVGGSAPVPGALASCQFVCRPNVLADGLQSMSTLLQLSGWPVKELHHRHNCDLWTCRYRNWPQLAYALPH